MPFRIWNVAWDRMNKGNAWGRTMPRNMHGALLDIGCGAGLFLRHIQEFNPDLRLVGCDPFGPEQAPALLSRGIDYHRRPVEGCAFKKCEFDCVTLNHVIEHQPYPDDLLDEIHRILKIGGRLHIGLPNTEGVGRRLFGSFWYGWDAPRHLVDFGQSSLVRLLVRHGFEILSVRHLSNAGHLLDSLAYSIFGNADPHQFWSRELVQQCLYAILGPIAGLTNLLSLGDNIEVTCVRS